MSATMDRRARNQWGAKLKKLAEAKKKAIEDELVGIYEARQAGLSQADAAFNLGDKSPSGIPAKEQKGKEIVERRRGSRGGSSTP